MKIFISALTTAVGAILLGLCFWNKLSAPFIIIAGVVLGVGWILAEFGEGRASK